MIGVIKTGWTAYLNFLFTISLEILKASTRRLMRTELGQHKSHWLKIKTKLAQLLRRHRQIFLSSISLTWRFSIPLSSTPSSQKKRYIVTQKVLSIPLLMVSFGKIIDANKIQLTCQRKIFLIKTEIINCTDHCVIIVVQLELPLKTMIVFIFKICIYFWKRK